MGQIIQLNGAVRLAVALGIPNASLFTQSEAYAAIGQWAGGLPFGTQHSRLSAWSALAANAHTHAVRILALHNSIGTGAYSDPNGTKPATWDTLGYVGQITTALKAALGDAGAGFRSVWDLRTGLKPTKVGTWSITGHYGAQSQAQYPTVFPGGTASLTWANVGPCSQVRLHYLKYNGLPTGTCSIAIDGGTPVDVDTSGNATPTYGHTDIDCGALGTHTVEVVCTDAGGRLAWVMGVEPLPYAATGVVVHNLSFDGGGLAQQIGDGPYTTGIIAALDADLTIIGGVTNDATPQSNLTNCGTWWDNAAVAGLRKSGNVQTASVLLLTDPQQQTAGTPITDAQYAAAMVTVATNRGCAILDLNTLWGAYGSWQAQGLAHDDKHPNLAGHTEIARMITGLLLQ